MKKVYFRSPGCLNLIGKVKKDYKVNDTFKLKNTTCKLQVVEIKNNELIVRPA